MESLAQVAAELSIPERTLRRSASQGLLHTKRIGARSSQVSLREAAYLRTHWQLLSRLRAALRTEPNVRLAVLFGSTAAGLDAEDSDADLLLALRDTHVGRLAELASRLSEQIDREVHAVRLSDAEDSPGLMVSLIDQGRVLVDRDGLWSKLRQADDLWRRRARRIERTPLAVAASSIAGMR